MRLSAVRLRLCRFEIGELAAVKDGESIAVIDEDLDTLDDILDFSGVMFLRLLLDTSVAFVEGAIDAVLGVLILLSHPETRDDDRDLSLATWAAGRACRSCSSCSSRSSSKAFGSRRASGREKTEPMSFNVSDRAWTSIEGATAGT